MTPEERLEAVFSGDLFTEDGYQIDHAVFVSMIRAAEADARKAAFAEAEKACEEFGAKTREQAGGNIYMEGRAEGGAVCAFKISALAAREEKT